MCCYPHLHTTMLNFPRDLATTNHASYLCVINMSPCHIMMLRSCVTLFRHVPTSHVTFPCCDTSCSRFILLFRLPCHITMSRSLVTLQCHVCGRCRRRRERRRRGGRSRTGGRPRNVARRSEPCSSPSLRSVTPRVPVVNTRHPRALPTIH